MKIFDFWFQALILIAYVIISPFLFGILYPTTGDVALIWIWVVVVTGIAATVSMIVSGILNVFVAPEKTYKIKGIIPLALSSFLMYNIGSRPNNEMEIMFLLGNIFLLVTLYSLYGIVYFKRIKSHKNEKN